MWEQRQNSLTAVRWKCHFHLQCISQELWKYSFLVCYSCIYTCLQVCKRVAECDVCWCYGIHNVWGMGRQKQVTEEAAMRFLSDWIMSSVSNQLIYNLSHLSLSCSATVSIPPYISSFLLTLPLLSEASEATATLGPRYNPQYGPDYRQNFYIPGSTATLTVNPQQQVPQQALPPPQALPPIEAPKAAQTPASKKKPTKKDKK